MPARSYPPAVGGAVIKQLIRTYANGGSNVTIPAVDGTVSVFTRVAHKPNTMSCRLSPPTTVLSVVAADATPYVTETVEYTKPSTGWRIKQTIRIEANSGVTIPAVRFDRATSRSFGSNSGDQYQCQLAGLTQFSNPASSGTVTTFSIQHDGSHNIQAEVTEWTD